MRITSVRLVNFGKYADKTFAFNEGLNIVVGPNEAGKTTIQTAIKAAFYGERLVYQRWHSWLASTEDCRVAVEYKLENGTAWRLEREFSKNNVSLTQTQGGDLTVGQTQKVSAFIKDHLVDDAAAFTGTVFVRANELATDLKDFETSLRERVESLLVGGDGASLTGALKQLDKRYKVLAGSVSQKGAGGRMGELLAAEAKLTEALAQAKAGEEAVREIIVRLEETNLALAKDEARLNLLRQLTESIKTKQSLHDQLEAIKERRLKIQKVIDQVEAGRLRKEQIDAATSTLSGPAAIDLEEAYRLEGIARELEAKQRILQSDGGIENDRESAERRVAVPAMIAGTGLLITALILLLSRQTAAGMVVLAAGAALAGAALYSNLKRGGERDAFLKEETDRLRELLDAGLEKVQMSDVAAVVKMRLDLDRLEREAADLSKAEKLLLDGQEMESLISEKGRLFDQEEAVKRRLDKMDVAPVSADEAFAFSRELAELETKTPALRQMRDRLVGSLDSPTGPAGRSASEIKSELELVRERLVATEIYARAVALARNEITNIGADISARVAPEIAERASTYFSAMTNGRYERITVGADLRPGLTVADHAVDIGSLSTGAADQLFFAVRLAAGEIIGNRGCPPVILDDPFVYFDAARLASARRIIESLAAERQIILFTHSDAYGDWADSLINP